MSHYEILGVAPDASDHELRRAYLRLARRYHPDRHATAGPAAAAEADAAMRRVNAAWQVLGSAASRAAYDRQLGAADQSGVAGVAVPDPRSRVETPSTAFRPYHDHDEDDDDSWRYEPDRGDPSTAPPRALLVGPPMLLAAAVVVLLAGLTLDSQGVVAVALIVGMLSLLMFVGAPVVTLVRSRSAEERAARRR